MSEDSESDHEKQQLPTAAISFNPKFDPCVGVDMIERKPGQTGPTVPKTHHTTSESSESDSESSDDSSSDEDPSRTSGSKNKNSLKSANTLNKPPEVNIGKYETMKFLIKVHIFKCMNFHNLILLSFFSTIISWGQSRSWRCGFQLE